MNLFSQNCDQFYLKCAENEPEEWIINEASKNEKVLPGQIVIIDFEILKGKDYIIAVCGDDFIGNLLAFKILDKDKTLLYDNSDDDYANEFSFSCYESKLVTLEVDIPDSGSTSQGCLGILIEHMITPKLGF